MTTHTTTAAIAEHGDIGRGTVAPFWAKAVGGVAWTAALLAISSYNIVPTLHRVSEGNDKGALGLAAVQIAFAIFLAIIPFVPGWDAKTRRWLTIAFMITNGWFAFEIAGHRHDNERTANNQHMTRDAELTGKQKELKNLGDFKPADEFEVTYAQNAAAVADTEKAAARKAVNDFKAKFAECKTNCGRLRQEATRLDGEATQKDMAATTAHKEFQEISNRRNLTNQATPIKARIAELQKQILEEKSVTDTSSNSEARNTIEAIGIAGMIECGNRFIPKGVFRFILFLGASLALHFQVKAHAVAEHKPAPVPSIELPAVPQIASAEAPAPVELEADDLDPAPAIPAAQVMEADAEPERPRYRNGMATDFSAPLPPTPLPPSPRKRRKPEQKALEPRLGNVIPFAAKKPTHSDVLALVASGKTQKQIAAIFGCTDRTIRNILSGKRAAESAISFTA
jgi:hypothetical protein